MYDGCMVRAKALARTARSLVRASGTAVTKISVGDQHCDCSYVDAMPENLKHELISS